MAILLSNIPVLRAAPVVAKHGVISSSDKAQKLHQRKALVRNGASKGSTVVKIQSGSDNYQDSTDNSVHIGHQDNRKYHSTHTSITYVTKVYNKTVIMPSVNGVRIGFAIFPASPLPTQNPLSIPFILMNKGTNTVYDLGYESIIHTFVTPGTRSYTVGMAMDDVELQDETIQRSVFGPDDHFPLSLEAALDLTGWVKAKPGAMADVEFIVRYSKRPAGPILRNSYRFSLVFVHGETWDWVRTN